MSTLLVFISVLVLPPSPLRVNLLATMSLVAPFSGRKPVPVTTRAPVDSLYAALVIVGTATLLTVIPLPVVSATSTAASAPAARAAAAAGGGGGPPGGRGPGGGGGGGGAGGAGARDV